MADDMHTSAFTHDRRRRALLIGGGLLAGAGSMAWAGRAPMRHTVLMDATAYAPLELTVHVGDSVEWVNKDPFPHTVTCAGVFDSGSIADAASWTYRPRKTGRFPYLCVFHPNMKGTLIVI